MARAKNICIEGARIIFRNFQGKGDRFNPEGRRTFGVIIDNEQALDLIEEGWRIKYLNPREEGEEKQAYLPVRVNYKTAPPSLYLVTKRTKTLLTEETVGTLDNAELENVDLVISPYHWSMPSKDGEDTGITAYIKSGYFTIVEDAFYEKYAKYDDPNYGKEEIPFD